MENKNQQNKDKEKTVILSSSANVNKEDFDKTIINSDDSASQKQTDNSDSKTSSQPKATSDTIVPPNKKVQKEGGKVSGGTFAAGVAGAAIAGTALGTTYAEEIKSTIDKIRSGNSELAEEEVIAEPNTEPLQPQEGNTSLHTHNVAEPSPESPENGIELSTTDENGNIYTVSFSDLDNDGNTDFAHVGVTMIDGTSIQVSASGEQFISSLFGGTNEIASAEDYENLGVLSTEGDGTFQNVSDSDFEVTNNDDVAEANTLTTGNPEIEILDSESDEIHELQPSEINENGGTLSTLPIENEIVSDDASTAVEMETGTNYDNIDWASFNDSPASIDNSNYGQALESMDFDNLSSLEGIEDQNFCDPGNSSFENEFL